MAAHAFPVPTKQFAAEVQGVRTDFVLQGFDNRVLVIATQLGKVGTVLHARCAARFPSLDADAPNVRHRGGIEQRADSTV